MALRAEKKAATRTALADAAMGLFLERGFDGVTVAEVAEAARVSVNTAFNYFPTKEDLFLDRQDAVRRRLADAVRASPGSPVAAVRALFLDELDRREPTLGLSADAARFWRVVEDSEALRARLRRLTEEAEAELAAALGPSAPPWAAPVLAGVDRALHAEIRRRLLSGADPATVRADIRTLAEEAFAAAARALP